RHLAHAENGVASLPERCRARQLGTLAVARLRRAHAEGSAERARGPAGELLDEATPRDGWARALRHAVAHLQLGAANAWRANPEPALEELRQALALARAAGLRGVALSALGRLALVQAVRAGPVPARELAAEALDEAEAHDLAATTDAAPAHLADAAIALSELRLADAGAAVAAARGALGEGASADLGATLELLAAELDAARGDAAAALRRSEALALRAETPAARALLSPLAALRARVLCDQLGDVAGACAVLAAIPSELRTAELDAAAARVALAGGDPAASLAALERARAARARLGVTPVEVALLAALAHEQLRDPDDADAALEHALGLAAATGHHGVLVAAGRSLEPLLRRRIRRRTAYAALVCGLLDAAQHGAPAVTRAAPPLLEPLSDREAMILRYLPTSLSNREIAGELFVSTNTVKTHLRSIYRKLDVGGRREAVERARALRLVAAGARR
ncbi:MAG TPA: LuxR C-terminal-related transcriptional regulator, partial [Solirubrobacter sp.]|nr:LuxR C-terminal-related transcriptional regulator [Solirubrobacter sp.]